MTAYRYTDSVYLQYLWDALEAPALGRSYDFEYIFKYIQTEKDPKCSHSKLQLELSNAVRDRCVTFSSGQYYKTDKALLPGKGKHDWYCFHCHNPGVVVCCPTCHRVYHNACLSAAAEAVNELFLPDEELSSSEKQQFSCVRPPSGSCPACLRANSTFLNPKTTRVDLRNIFVTALDRMRSKNPWRLLYTIGYVNEPARNEFLSYKQINTRDISEKMRKDINSPGAYKNRTALFMDLDLLVHNTCVIYGSKADMTNTARQIRSQLQKEMRESSLCVDCYLRTKGGKPDSKQIVQACRNPHRLMWFNHSRWSFRPCKVLHESDEGYEVVCFDGRHEREFIPPQSAVAMTFTAAQLGLRVTASLKKALAEAKQYKENQRLWSSNKLNVSSSNYQSFCHSNSPFRTSESESSISIPPTPSSDRTSSDYDGGKVTGSKASGQRRRRTSSKVVPKREVSNDESSSAFNNYSSDGVAFKSADSSVASAAKPYSSSKGTISSRVSNSKSRLNEVSPRVQLSLEARTSHRVNPPFVPRLRSVSSSSCSDSSTSSSGSSSSYRANGQCSQLKADRDERPRNAAGESTENIRSKPSNLQPNTGAHSSNSVSAKLKRRHSQAIGNSENIATSSSSSTLSTKSSSLGSASGSTTVPATSSPKADSCISGSVSRTGEIGRNFSHKLDCLGATQFLNRMAVRDSDGKSISSASSAASSPSKSTTYKSSSPLRASTESLTTRTEIIVPDTREDSSLGSDTEDDDAASSRLDSTSSSGHLGSGSKSKKIRPRLSDDHSDDRYRSSWLANSTSKALDASALTRRVSSRKSREFSFIASNREKLFKRSQNSCDTYAIGGNKSISKRQSKERGSEFNGSEIRFTGPAVGSSVSPKSVMASVPQQTNMNYPSAVPSNVFSSAASSASSVSPAALSSSSGIGSSLSDQKSVDASPGDMGLNLHSLSIDPAIVKAIEERTRQQMSQQIDVLTRERDAARENLFMMQDLMKKLRSELLDCKKRSWCTVCLKEALYHCCAGVAYCSKDCQLQHWTSHHNEVCRRMTETQRPSSGVTAS